MSEPQAQVEVSVPTPTPSVPSARRPDPERSRKQPEPPLGGDEGAAERDELREIVTIIDGTIDSAPRTPASGSRR
jgi:hypothetical protein